jgi:MYXO-CTERM domain-containing protein
MTTPRPKAGLTAQDFAVIVGVAVVASVAGVLIQYLIFGETNGAVSGGAAAGVAAVVALRRMRRRQEGQR